MMYSIASVFARSFTTRPAGGFSTDNDRSDSMSKASFMRLINCRLSEHREQHQAIVGSYFYDTYLAELARHDRDDTTFCLAECSSLGENFLCIYPLLDNIQWIHWAFNDSGITDGAVHKIATTAFHVHTLNLANNQITNASAANLIQLFQAGYLKALDLRGNAIDEKTALIIQRAAYQAGLNLRNIQIDESSFSQEAKQEIETMMLWADTYLTLINLVNYALLVGMDASLLLLTVLSFTTASAELGMVALGAVYFSVPVAIVTLMLLADRLLRYDEVSFPDPIQPVVLDLPPSYEASQAAARASDLGLQPPAMPSAQYPELYGIFPMPTQPYQAENTGSFIVPQSPSHGSSQGFRDSFSQQAAGFWAKPAESYHQPSAPPLEHLSGP